MTEQKIEHLAKWHCQCAHTIYGDDKKCDECCNRKYSGRRTTMV